MVQYRFIPHQLHRNLMKALGLRRRFSANFDFLIVALMIGAFVIVASQRLGTVPVPETDEAYILQVPYEMLNRGQLSWPMYRYLGGNIENVWHTFSPLFFLLLSGFFKLFGWGILQGRVFMLVSACLVLLMVHLIGRRLVNWRVGLLAVGMLLADQTFFERSRLLRYDFTAAFFALLGFYLFEKADKSERSGYYIASGLAVGAGVMCHPNILYMLGGLGLLMLFRHGWPVIKQKKLYQFTLSALAVMSYVIVYDIIDYKNFLLQNRGDKLHFGLFEEWGIWHNLVGETRRYGRWLSGGELFLNVPRTTLWLFQLLALGAFIYLLVYAARQIKRGNWINKPRVRLLIITIVAVLFHALLLSQKGIYYMAHLTPWFALCVGVMLNDAFNFIGRLGDLSVPRAKLLQRATVVVCALAIIAFGLQLARQNRRYLREVHNPELVQFDEIKSVLRAVVPEGVCPVAIKSPVMWLSFPEHDRCFATIENRMTEALDLDGNEYVVIAPYAYDNARLEGTKELDAKYPLIARLVNTRFGTIHVYYTGTKAYDEARVPVTQYFFGQWRGHVSLEDADQGPEVWSAGAAELASWTRVFDSAFRAHPDDAHRDLIQLGSVDLASGKIYWVDVDTDSNPGNWELVITSQETGDRIHEETIGPAVDRPRDGPFKLVGTNRITRIAMSVRRAGSDQGGPLRIARMSIREVAPAGQWSGN